VKDPEDGKHGLLRVRFTAIAALAREWRLVDQQAGQVPSPRVGWVENDKSFSPRRVSESEQQRYCGQPQPRRQLHFEGAKSMTTAGIRDDGKSREHLGLKVWMSPANETTIE
jgi:hypothetical protein